jgi:hypothetical protein
MEKRKYKWRCKAIGLADEVLFEHPIMLYGLPWPMKATGGGCDNDFDHDVQPGEIRLCDGDIKIILQGLGKSVVETFEQIKVLEVTNDIQQARLEVTEFYPMAIDEEEEGVYIDVCCKFNTGILKNITPIDFASLSDGEPSTHRNTSES